MKRKFYPKFTSVLVVILFLTASLKAQVVAPTITGPAGAGMVETVAVGLLPELSILLSLARQIMYGQFPQPGQL